jgi:PIN domain nuclease of toxin-antitoxin system
VRLLLDTHTLLWWLGASRRLGRTARALIASPDSTVWVSAATAWEIAIKTALGRLDLGEPPEVCLPREIERGGFRPLPVGLAHALAVRALPPHHSDPFDRLLIAQAGLEGLTLVTADASIPRYGVPTIDATV